MLTVVIFVMPTIKPDCECGLDSPAAWVTNIGTLSDLSQVFIQGVLTLDMLTLKTTSANVPAPVQNHTFNQVSICMAVPHRVFEKFTFNIIKHAEHYLEIH